MSSETGEAEAGSVRRGRKAEKTREQILNAALELFAERGYQATTLRDIAARADVALGLTYRYFPSKEAFVIALYERLVTELEEEAALLPPGTLADRVAAVMRADLRRCEPYRGAFAALAGIGMMPDSEVAVLGAQATPVRTRVWQVYFGVVTGATDSAKGQRAEELTTLIYAAHLLLVLFWLQDRSEAQQATQELISVGHDALARFRFLLRLPQVAALITRVVGILRPMVGPMRTAAEHVE
ncbi:MAG: helix-turn-helix domain-containing protein [Capsulimonadales bacterium]|nr:helix-turn-helix domain-containing protein [Capsulimonadales bacterium]